MRFTRDIDRIRVKPRKRKRVRADERACEWDGCAEKGLHRAPKAPNRLREYRWFCVAHARDYNRGWNFFSGMSDEEIGAYLKNNITGQRPTWSVGSGGGKSGEQEWRRQFEDSFNLFGDSGGPADGSSAHKAARHRPPPLVRAALDSLGLDETATLNQVKVRYKELVKRFHPDANGGDRAMEGRLEQVIQAYNHLKASGHLKAGRSK